MRGEASQVTVQQEARLGVESVRDGEQIDRVAVLCDEVQRLNPTIDLHLADLRMRRPERFGQMLHRLFALKIDAHNFPAFVALEKIVQPAVKEKIRRAHAQIICPPAENDLWMRQRTRNDVIIALIIVSYFWRDQ